MPRPPEAAGVLPPGAMDPDELVAPGRDPPLGIRSKTEVAGEVLTDAAPRFAADVPHGPTHRHSWLITRIVPSGVVVT